MTKEREAYEEEVDGLVSAMAAHLLQELALGNRTSVRWQLAEGNPEEAVPPTFQEEEEEDALSDGMRKRLEAEKSKLSVEGTAVR